MNPIDRTLFRAGVGAIMAGGVGGVALTDSGDHDNSLAVNVASAAMGAFGGAVVSGAGVGAVAAATLAMGGPSVVRNPLGGASAITVGLTGLAMVGAVTTGAAHSMWGREM